MADVFISYARIDRPRIEKLAAALEAAGHSVWWDRHITGGSEFSDDIERELDAARVAIVVWSKDSAKSRWVRDEAGQAAEDGKLVAISLDGSAPPMGFRQFHAIDFSRDEAEAMADLRRSLALKMDREAPNPTPSVTTPAANAWSALSRNRKLLILTLVGALIAIGINFIVHDPLGLRGGEQQVEAQSLAILPFENRSAGEEDGYFAAGMHDDLLTQLAQLSGLKVISRNSVQQFAASKLPTSEIAKKLGANAILNGSVQRAGDRVRVSVQLVDGATDANLWAESFDRELTAENLFEIQTEIAKAIASKLSAVLTASDQARLAERPTGDTAAYNAYLRGIALDEKGTLSLEQLEKAAAAYREALERDPDFALARMRLAGLLIRTYWWHRDKPEYAQAAKEELRALEGDYSDHPYFLAVSGAYLYRVENDYRSAGKLLEEAIESAPNDADTRYLYSLILRRDGEFEESIEQMRRAENLDPVNPTIKFDLALLLNAMGRYQEARESQRAGLELDADSQYGNVTNSVMAVEAGRADELWKAYLGNRRTRYGNNRFAYGAIFMTSLIRDPEKLEVIENDLIEIGAGSADAPPQDRAALFLIQYFLGREGSAERLRAATDAIPNVQNTFFIARKAINYAHLGDREKAIRFANESYQKRPRDDALWPSEEGSQVADTFALVGEPERGLAIVEKGMDDIHVSHFARIANSKNWEKVRSHPRYKELEARYLEWKRTQG